MRENYCATLIDSGTEGDRQIDKQVDRWTKKKLKKENIQGKQKRLMLYLREGYHLSTFTFLDCRIFVKKHTETLQVHQISAKE